MHIYVQIVIIFECNQTLQWNLQEYVAWILLCKHGKFGEEIYYNSRYIKFFLGDYFFWHALYIFVFSVAVIIYLVLTSHVRYCSGVATLACYAYIKQVPIDCL